MDLSSLVSGSTIATTQLTHAQRFFDAGLQITESGPLSEADWEVNCATLGSFVNLRQKFREDGRVAYHIVDECAQRNRRGI